MGEGIAAGIYGIICIVLAILVFIVAVVWLKFPFMVKEKMDELLSIQREQGKVLIDIAAHIRAVVRKDEPMEEAPPVNEFNRFSGQSCKCNVCSKLIEFQMEQVGQTVACPHCGMETKLFIPKVSA